jgi:excisionase family DNA binding protein
MTISIPDLGITLVEELPSDKKLNKDYVTRLGMKIAEAWVKAQKIMKDKASAKKYLPEASDIRSSLKKPEKALSPARFAELVGVSKRTIIRDCQKRIIRARQTTGGHFKIPFAQVGLYQEYLKQHKKHARDHWLKKAMERLQNLHDEKV